MDELEINRLLKTVYNKKIYIVAIILFFMFAGYIYSYYYVTPKYKSETTIILIKNSGDSSANEITQSDINLNQKLVSTYGEIIKSNKVLRAVIKNLDLDLTESQLNNLISVKDVSNTEILKITVVNENASKAKIIANEVAKVFSEEVMRLYKIDNINIIDAAEEATIPYNINHVKDIIIFAIIGLAFSVCFVFLLYYFDSTIKEESDVEAFIGLNLLTTIPMHQKYMRNNKKIQDKEEKLEELITYEDYKSPISEFFRTLRTNIMFTQTTNNTNIRTILVTSGMMGEGKSWVTANLATAFAQSNKKVLLIDSDMRKGRQHHIFKVNNKYGLSNCLAMNSEEVNDINNFKKYIQETKINNLHIITSGNRPPNPSELLSSNKMKSIVNTLEKIYDVIVFDGTPCMLVSDSIILSNIMDTTIVVAEYRKSKIENTKKLKKSIENAGGTIGGLVLNKLPISVKSYKSKYYYGEKSESSEEVAVKAVKNEENKKPQTVEELIESSKVNILPQIEVGKKINFNSDMSIDDKIVELENMIERYFMANNELIKNNMEKMEELKSNVSELSSKSAEQNVEAKKVEENNIEKKKAKSKKTQTVKTDKKEKETKSKEVKAKSKDSKTTKKAEEKKTKSTTKKKTEVPKETKIKTKKVESKITKVTKTPKTTKNDKKIKEDSKEKVTKQQVSKREKKNTNILKLIIGENNKEVQSTRKRNSKKIEEQDEPPISQLLRL